MSKSGIRTFPAHIQAIVRVVQSVFTTGVRPDKALMLEFRRLGRPGARDRAVVAETSYNIIRHWHLWWHLMEAPPATGETQLKKLVLSYLDLLHQLKENAMSLEFWLIEQKKLCPPAVYYSIPDAVWQLGLDQLGQDWEEEVAAQNSPSLPHLRVNSLKALPEVVVKTLSEESVITRPHEKFPDVLVVQRQGRNIFSTRAFREGWIELQDAGSQEVGRFAAPQPGDRVVDACAGAGGKTLHMAALMGNKGRILSLDVDSRKLHELRRRTSRAGVQIVETRSVENRKILKRLLGTADLVLVDAPCTGSGTWRRNPDLKYRLSEAWLQRCTQTQHTLLRQYAALVKPGGRLVYATCSILPDENQNQWQRFLEDYPMFEHLESRHILPSRHACDGFFMASARRKG